MRDVAMHHQLDLPLLLVWMLIFEIEKVL